MCATHIESAEVQRNLTLVQNQFFIQIMLHHIFKCYKSKIHSVKMDSDKRPGHPILKYLPRLELKCIA